MALESRPLDDEELMPESVVTAEKSTELFKAIIEDLLEDGDLRVREDANFILGKLQNGEVGIICDNRIRIGLENHQVLLIRDEYDEEQIIVTQVVLGDKFVPVFVITPDLNAPDIFDQIHAPAFLGITPSREYRRPLVQRAVTNMAFALRAAERLGSSDRQ